MSLPKCGILAFIFTITATAAWTGTHFHCGLKPISGGAWVPSRITARFSDDFTTATVTIAAFGASVPARVVARSDASYALHWSLPGLVVLTETGRAEPRFRAVLNTANLKISIQAAGFGTGGQQLPRGAGSCQRKISPPVLTQNAPRWK